MQDLQKHQKPYTSFYSRMSKYEIYAETYAFFLFQYEKNRCIFGW